MLSLATSQQWPELSTILYIPVAKDALPVWDSGEVFMDQTQKLEEKGNNNKHCIFVLL